VPLQNSPTLNSISMREARAKISQFNFIVRPEKKAKASEFNEDLI
jgi:hypothetical protein